MTHPTDALRLVPISRGDLHTALMDAIHGDLMRQNPGAFVEEDGNSTLAIPTSKAFLTVDVSSLAEAALSAAPASPLPEGGGWQDISTAPKDGTPILAWCVHPHARWAGDDRDWAAPVVTSWTTHNGGGWTWHGMIGTFTHWMPLPAAPTGEARNGKGEG